ncbi:3'-5' exonuclease [Puniceicoccaceae bacterium K14]|nr:3'-5' exonuclease [Puniceicoccaceae bacterium K14]
MKFPWTKAKSTDPIVSEYEEKSRLRRMNRKAPLSSVRFVVLDAETSGFDKRNDRMLSLAAFEVTDNRISIQNMCSWTIFQSNASLTEAVKVHGILPDETMQGQQEYVVMRELIPFLTGAVVVGHHIGFDAMMIDMGLQRHFGISFCNPIVDTADLAMRALDAFAQTGYANQRPPSLDEVCSQCDIEMWLRHTAEGDAFTTAELFLYLCAKRRKLLGKELLLKDLPIRKY